MSKKTGEDRINELEDRVWKLESDKRDKIFVSIATILIVTFVLILFAEKINTGLRNVVEESNCRKLCETEGMTFLSYEGGAYGGGCECLKSGCDVKYGLYEEDYRLRCVAKYKHI